MKPESVGEHDAFEVLGVLTRINPWKADYRAIWQEQYAPHDRTVSGFACEEGYYSVYFPCQEAGKVEVLCGRAVADIDEAPEGLVLREIPKGTYATFECTLESIGSTWRDIYGIWLAQAGEHAEDEGKPSFEYYPPGVDEGKAKVSIWVPIKKR